jgi:hypothetical protein
MFIMNNSHYLRTTPIHPHFMRNDKKGYYKLGKKKRAPGDLVSHSKPFPKYIPPPSTNIQNLSLDLDIILPEESKSILDSNLLVFHTVGDTGGIHGDDVEKAIADAMSSIFLKHKIIINFHFFFIILEMLFTLMVKSTCTIVSFTNHSKIIVLRYLQF